MLAAINLTQLAASVQAVPVMLFGHSQAANDRLTQYQADNAKDEVCFVQCVISSVDGVDTARFIIKQAVRFRLNKLGMMPGKDIICAPHVNEEGQLNLEVWHSPAK